MAELAKRRSDKKKEEKRVELDTRRAKSATTYLDMPIRWQHFKVDGPGSAPREPPVSLSGSLGTVGQRFFLGAAV